MQRTIPFSYIRGGTSKAVFFHEADLPPPGPGRDKLILRLMGSPDPMQIDGMGGTHPVTSKVAIINKSERKGIDVEYLFAQVSIETAKISYDGGCGNISAAVGPFAINEGLITAKTSTQDVSIWMVGTETRLIARVPVDVKTGRAREAGDYRIYGCPGSGAPIIMDYKDTGGGAVKKGMLPTSTAVNEVSIRGQKVTITICDVAHIIVFGRAADFGIAGDEESHVLTANQRLICDIREIRGKAAQLIGMCTDWRKVDEEAPNLPYVVLLSEAKDANIQARLFLDNHCHTSMAGAGAACIAACGQIAGSLVNSMARQVAEYPVFCIKHPLGLIPVEVKTRDRPGHVEFETLSFIRTARYIAKGELFVPEDWSSGNFGEQIYGGVDER